LNCLRLNSIIYYDENYNKLNENNNLCDMSIDDDDSYFDVLELEYINVKDFLRTNRNKNNVVIKRKSNLISNFIVIDKNRLLSDDEHITTYDRIKINDFNHDKKPDYDVKRLDGNLFYPCLSVDNDYDIDNDIDIDIHKNNRCINIPFVNLRDFGLDGMLYFNDINQEFMNHKYFVLVQINVNIIGFISSNVLISETRLVGSLHCQSGQETTYVYRLFPIKDSKINEIISEEPPLKRQRKADGKRKKKSKKKSKKTSKRKSSIKKKSIKKKMRKKSIKT